MAVYGEYFVPNYDTKRFWSVFKNAVYMMEYELRWKKETGKGEKALAVQERTMGHVFKFMRLFRRGRRNGIMAWARAENGGLYLKFRVGPYTELFGLREIPFVTQNIFEIFTDQVGLKDLLGDFENAIRQQAVPLEVRSGGGRTGSVARMDCPHCWATMVPREKKGRNYCSRCRKEITESDQSGF